MKALLLILFVFLSIPLSAQLKPSTNDVTLVKEIDVKKYIGKQYKISAEVKTSAIDGIGQAAVMVLQVGEKIDFLDRTRKKAGKIINNQDWKTCQVEGKIDEQAIKLWLYLLTYGNGDFYLDNIRFEILNGDKNWIDVPLYNGGFEKSTKKMPLKGLENIESVIQKKNVWTNILTNDNPKYDQVLHIHSENAQPDNRIIYGFNKKAGHNVNINGIKMYYETYGKGEPLILLHGNGGSINSFSKQIPELSKYYKVIAVDTRGQGNSIDTNTLNFSYNQFANDLKVLMDSLQLKNVNLLGWSDGGNTGLILASKHPDYVKCLITMGANLNPTENAIRKKTLNKVKRDIERLKAQDKPELTVTIRLIDMLLKEPHINPEHLKSITAKTLVIAAENDEILEKHTRLIAENIPNSKLIILKGQSHFVVEENPILFNNTVLEFLLNQAHKQ